VRELSTRYRGRTPVLVPVSGSQALLQLASCPAGRPYTPLTRATELSYPEGIRSSLRSGSNPQKTGSHRRPPLVWSVGGGHLEAIRFYWADIGHDGWTPLPNATPKWQLSAVLSQWESGVGSEG
jgi:hypothetical protein